MGQGGVQPLLGVHRDSKKAPNKNIDPDIPGTHTGPLKRSSFVKMSKAATVESATPNPRQMIAKKYFTFVPSTYRRILTFERRLWPDKIAAPRSAAARPATGTAIADGHIAEVRGARPGRLGPRRWLPVARPKGLEKEAKGLEKEFCESRVDMSALQPAKPNDISTSAAMCGTRREQSHSTTRDMVTHSYTTNYCFE
jgi:hypothetical protein